MACMDCHVSLDESMIVDHTNDGVTLGSRSMKLHVQNTLHILYFGLEIRHNLEV